MARDALISAVGKKIGFIIVAKKAKQGKYHIYIKSELKELF